MHPVVQFGDCSIKHTISDDQILTNWLFQNIMGWFGRQQVQWWVDEWSPLIILLANGQAYQHQVICWLILIIVSLINGEGKSVWVSEEEKEEKDGLWTKWHLWLWGHNMEPCRPKWNWVLVKMINTVTQFWGLDRLILSLLRLGKMRRSDSEKWGDFGDLGKPWMVEEEARPRWRSGATHLVRGAGASWELQVWLLIIIDIILKGNSPAF